MTRLLLILEDVYNMVLCPRIRDVVNRKSFFGGYYHYVNTYTNKPNTSGYVRFALEEGRLRLVGGFSDKLSETTNGYRAEWYSKNVVVEDQTTILYSYRVQKYSLLDDRHLSEKIAEATFKVRKYDWLGFPIMLDEEFVGDGYHGTCVMKKVPFFKYFLAKQCISQRIINGVREGSRVVALFQPAFR